MKDVERLCLHISSLAPNEQALVSRFPRVLPVMVQWVSPQRLISVCIHEKQRKNLMVLSSLVVRFVKASVENMCMTSFQADKAQTYGDEFVQQWMSELFYREFCFELNLFMQGGREDEDRNVSFS